MTFLGSGSAVVEPSARERAERDRPLGTVALFMRDLTGGGAERMMLNLAAGFVAHGTPVDLVLVQKTGRYVDEIPQQVRVVELGSGSTLRAIPMLAGYLRRERPLALISTLQHANVSAVWAKRLARSDTPVLLREANMIRGRVAAGWKGRIMPSFVRRFYGWADGMIAVSDGVADDLQRFTGAAPDAVRTLYNPVVTPDIARLAREPVDHPWFREGAPPVVMGVGRLAPQKDFPSLLRAFARVRSQRPARLMILGEGDERQELQLLARELGIEEDVQLPGFRPNPFAYMARAGVFVLSSRWEGLPGVLIQALACGCPVVSTDCPSGPREVLEDGRWGPLVGVGDVDALAAAIGQQLDGPVDAASLRGAARRFSVDEVVPRYLGYVVEAAVRTGRLPADAQVAREGI